MKRVLRGCRGEFFSSSKDNSSCLSRKKKKQKEKQKKQKFPKRLRLHTCAGEPT